MQRNDCVYSKGDVDVRDQWKSNKMMVDIYWLCHSISRYKGYYYIKHRWSSKIHSKIGYKITDDLIINNLCPHIASLLPRQITLILGQTLLWEICIEYASLQINNWTKIEQNQHLITQLVRIIFPNSVICCGRQWKFWQSMK